MLRAHKPAGGSAETRQDHETPTAQKFSITISMCKALDQLGLLGWRVDAVVHFHQGASKGIVTNRHKGDWYEYWHQTPEFEAFWKSALGRRWAYVQKGGDGKQLIPAATREEIDRSSTVPQMSYRK
jgi:hypothetical protein